MNTQPITCFELIAALDKLWLSQAAFGRMCGVRRNQVHRWCKYGPVPVYADSIIRLLLGANRYELKYARKPLNLDVCRHHVFRNDESYRTLAKRFHPDLSGRDTTREMQFVNRFRKS